MRKLFACVLASTFLFAAIATAQQTDRLLDGLKHAQELRDAEAKRFSAMRSLVGSATQPKQSLDEQHVDLNLRIDPKMRTIQGTVPLQFIPTATLHKLIIKLQQPLRLTAATLDQKSIPFQRNGSNLIFKLDPALTADSAHVVTIVYDGTPGAAAARFGGILFDTHSGTASATTLSEPFGCSNWWPCIDDLADKLTADIS